MVMPSRPCPGLVFVQTHIALFRLELRFNAPPGTAHVGQGLQGSIRWGVGQVVARLAAVHVTSPDGPDHLAGLAPPAIVRRCPPTSLGLRGAPRPWYAGLVRSVSGGHTVKPAGTSWTYRVPSAASPSRKGGDIRKRRPRLPSQPSDGPAPRPAAASPGPTPSSSGSSAALPAPPPPHSGRVRGPTLGQIQPFVHQGAPQRADISPGTSRLGSWPPCPVCRSIAGPLPQTSCPAWGSRCRPAPTPHPDAPDGVPSTLEGVL